jgi:uncharacterized protein with PQ loop repeat
MDVKLLAAASGAVIGIGFTIPYIIHTIRGKTQPHLYTWLIWTVTQGIAAAGVYVGNGGWTALGMSLGAATIGCVACLALFYGTKNIHIVDTILLAGAATVLLIWFFMESPLYAVLTATLIDFFGYIPTLRKTWQEPESETMSMWFFYIIATVLSLLGLREYNMLTMSYLAMCIPMNTLVFLACMKRFACTTSPARSQ